MSLDLILKRTDRLIQHIEEYYKSNDVGKCVVNQLYVATWEWYEFSLKLFHIWAYMFLGCFIGFWCLLLIGKLLRNFVLSSSNNGNGTTILSTYHGKQTTCQPLNEPWWKTLLLQINMLLSFPTFSQVWSLGIFLVIFFYGGQTGKTFLLIYYIHLFTDQAPQHFGWDNDVSWIMCLLGGSGQRTTRNDDGNKETKSQQSSPSSTSWWWTRLFHMGFPFRHVCRNAYNFQLVREYFNSELIKTSDDLSPNKNYLFLYHPHGIMAIGASSTLSTDVAGFPELFPGIHRSTCVLNACFLIPFFRDWMLANGFVSANRSTMIKHLTTTTKTLRKSLILMPGGSAEALHAHPGIFRVYLKHRKGFIKIALETGCSLVPCLGFGENEVYETLYTHDNDTKSNGNDQQKMEVSPDKTKMREDHEKENARKNNSTSTFEQNGNSSKGTNSRSPKRKKNHNMKHQQTSKTTSSTTSKNNSNNNMAQLLYTLFVEGQYKKLFFTCQRQLAKWLTFSVPILTHVLPKRTKITVVVGEPIEFSTTNDGGTSTVTSSSSTTTTKLDPKLVDECHELYCQKLKELYDKHKSKYGIPGVELEIV